MTMAESTAAKRRWTTWIWAAVAVCLLGLVVRQLRWHDHAYLVTGPAETQRVRIIARHADRLVVMTNEGQRELPSERFEPSPIEAGPRIDYGLRSVLVHLRWQWAMLAVLAFAPAPLLAALRWQKLLDVGGVHITRWQALKLSYAGAFFNIVSLGMTGGDLVKAYYRGRHPGALRSRDRHARIGDAGRDRRRPAMAEPAHGQGPLDHRTAAGGIAGGACGFLLPAGAAFTAL
jgi:hypothetical protein